MTGHTRWSEIQHKGLVQRPAVIVDNWLIFPDGHCRKMSWWERYRWWRGRLKTVKR